MQTIIKTRVSITPICSAKKPETPINVTRKNFETKRTASLKENVNKLLLIAASDVQEYSDFFKELDVIHKKELASWVARVKEHVSEVVPRGPVSQKETEDEDENIFKKKDEGGDAPTA
jgi:hypothetical protein